MSARIIDGKQIHDPSLYDRMCEPHQDITAAVESYNAFFEEVAAARERYRISDVAVVCILRSKDENGKPHVSMVYGNRGDARLVPTMLASALGEARKREQADLDALAGVKRHQKSTRKAK